MNEIGHNSLFSLAVDVDRGEVVVTLGLGVVVSFGSVSEVFEIDVVISFAMTFDGITRSAIARIKEKLIFFIDAKVSKGFIV